MLGRAVLIVVVLLAAAHCDAQGLDDCTSLGPGCLQCENVTLARGSHGHGGEGPSDASYEGRQWGSSWQGRRGLKHGGGEGQSRRHGPVSDTSGEVRSRLVCIACDDNGYTLITRPNSTYGFCQCATGWGVDPADNSTDSGGDGRRRHNPKCVDCSLEGKVPLTDKSNLRLSWDGENWGVVLASSAGSASVGVQHADGTHEGHRHGGWSGPGVQRPWQAGVCVSCPDGSAPSSAFSACVADGSAVSSPSPPPVDDSPAPAPSPDPSDLGPCLRVTSDDISILESDISDTCSLFSNDSVSLDAFGWADDSNMFSVYFSSVPNIMADTADATTGLTDAACSKMASLQGQDVTVTWLVTDAGITCSPATGTFTLTIPTWDSTGSSGTAQSDLQNGAAVLPLVTAPTGTAAAARRRVARRRRSSGFKLVAHREQQAAATTANVDVLHAGTLPAAPAAVHGVTSAAGPAAVTITVLPATGAAVVP